MGVNRQLRSPKELPKRLCFQLLAWDWQHTPAAAMLPSAAQPISSAFLHPPSIDQGRPSTMRHPSRRTFFWCLELDWALLGSSGYEHSSLTLEIWWAESQACCEQSSWWFGHCSIRRGLFQPPETKQMVKIKPGIYLRAANDHHNSRSCIHGSKLGARWQSWGAIIGQSHDTS